MTYCIILCTCETEQEARTLAGRLVKEQLAACAQIHPVTSIYTWEDEIHTDPEFRLIIKTRNDLYNAVEKRICALHSYEVPQIVKLPIEEGLPAYLNWIDDTTLSP